MFKARRIERCMYVRELIIIVVVVIRCHLPLTDCQ